MDRRRHRVRGSVSLERGLLVATVALAGAGGLAAWGRGAKSVLVTEGYATNRAAPPVISAQAAVEDAARLSAKILSSSVELADEVRPIRTAKWSAQRYAFGDLENPIQLALEYEGDADSIVGAYHPAEVDFHEWEAMDEEEQIDWLYDHARRVGTRTRRHFHWEKFIRRIDAPDTLVDHLTSDLGRWETKTHGHVTTQDSLFEAATFLAENVGDGGFHWHTSFRHNPKYDAHVLAYWQHMEEYLRLRAIFEDADNVDSRFLKPLSHASVDEAAAALRGDNPEARLGTLYKFHTVGLRDGVYGEPGRMGYEIRAANFDLGEAARMVESTVRFLEHPDTAKVRFHAGVRPYAIKDLIAVDPYAMHPVPPDIERHLARGSKGAEREQDAVLWHMPYVRWEDRPFLAAHAERLAVARANFERGVRALAGDRKSSLAGSAKRDDFAELLQAWVRETNLPNLY